MAAARKVQLSNPLGQLIAEQMAGPVANSGVITQLVSLLVGKWSKRLRASSAAAPARALSDAPYLGILDQLRSMGVSIEHDEGPLRCILLGYSSSGKTSVVEAMSGITLPHGDSTRVVTETRMRKGLPGSNFAARVFITANRLAVKEVSSPNGIRSAIKEKTKELARGKSKKVEAELVVVEVTSPDVPDLTMMDLPGLDELEGLDYINSLVEGSHSMILAVLPMTQGISSALWKHSDVTSSSAFKLIQMIDPTGKSTIGVFTKPNLLDDCSMTAVSSSLADAFPLGGVMLLGRSQTNIDDGVRIEEAKEREIAWFDAHPELRTVTDDLLVGVDDLIALLSRVAQLRRRGTRPKIKEFRQAMSSASINLASLDPDPGKNVEEKRSHAAILPPGLQELGPPPRRSRQHLPDDFDAAVNASKPDFRAADNVDELVASGSKFSGSQLADLSESVRGLVVTVARKMLQEFGSHVAAFVDQVLPLLDDVARGLEKEPSQRIAASFEIERRPFSRNTIFTDAVEGIVRAKPSKKEEAEAVLPRLSRPLHRGDVRGQHDQGADHQKHPRSAPLRSRPSLRHQIAEADHLASTLEAFWQISSSRIVDSVIGHVPTCIVDGLATQLDLKVQALLSDDASVLAISEEDPAFKRRRELLQDKIKGLVAVKEELATLELAAV
ncbi:P-loop containing nucleoside triphosphate hydrolase protein [Blyttiomyces helicus]|uniref:P-loop containing nucleoside triphosphate hydrolase protein n=1 Tax=Blyttiomyces helicus TaxID=388810 RepID=A0A4P9WI98_9FUNG|nr:P-loop containing nucleoside triphosphate hydrolase protein [Blyttiomyces helicus]|eukprot:RKO92581.1 P-loop containing nucleoside triphosphate hydrolase protein [Blyttiomyces helicus]